MGVLTLSNQSCIRVFKESVALMDAGVPMEFMAQGIPAQEMVTALSPVTFYNSMETLAVELEKVRSETIHLIHAHNEPDWLVTAAKTFRPDLPLVYDCHDLNCMRTGKAHPDEVIAMQMADAYIFPSVPYMEGAVKYHNLPDTKPRAVIYSMNLKSMIVKTEMSRVGGIVYEGGLVAPTEEVSSSVAPYRDYRETARIMSKMGMLFTVCSKIDPSEFNNPKHKDRNAFIRNEYWRAGAIFFNALPQNLLMQQLSRYDWGLLGHPESFPQWHTGIPNKLFDYISAGIPVIVLNADECARFVETHGIGVVIDRIEDIPKVYNDHKKYRKRVKQVQGKFTMEQQVPVIKAIYRKLMEDKNAEG